MNDETRPSLEDSLEKLRNLDEFAVVCEEVIQERETAISKLWDAPDAHETAKLAGVVTAYDNLHALLSGK